MLEFWVQPPPHKRPQATVNIHSQGSLPFLFVKQHHSGLSCFFFLLFLPSSQFFLKYPFLLFLIPYFLLSCLLFHLFLLFICHCDLPCYCWDFSICLWNSGISLYSMFGGLYLCFLVWFFFFFLRRGGEVKSCLIFLLPESGSVCVTSILENSKALFLYILFLLHPHYYLFLLYMLFLYFYLSCLLIF